MTAIIVLLFISTLVIFSKGAEVELQGSKENFDEVKMWVRESEKEGSERIVGGKEVPKHGFPSIVLLYHKDRPICGGTIVHEEWIVSAAHCIISLTPSNYKFSAGDHDKDKNENTEQIVTALEIHKHEKYESGTYSNDIVLFKVTPSLKFNEFVKKVILADPELDPYGLATVVGWGKLTEEKKGKTSSTLQAVDVPILTNEKCAKSYSSILPEMICAGYDEGGKDSCQGDSGGPLYFKEGEKQILIGIVSYGTGCARPGFPGVYTRVSSYIEWMEERTGVVLRVAPAVKKERSCICITFEE